MMRSLFAGLLFIVSWLTSIACCDTLAIMSFNIRYDNPSDGAYSWAQRKEKVFDAIRKENPKLIGLQEVLQNQEEDLLRAFQGYSSFGAGRDDGQNAGEHSLIMFDTSCFERISGSTFWLSEDPGEPGSISWDAACTRIVTWAKFRDLGTGEEVFFFNTHFDHMSRKARTMSARLLVDSIARITGSGNVILTGDFNSVSTDKSYKIINGNSKKRLSDARLAAAETVGPDCTFVGFPAVIKKGYCIDFIFISETFTKNVYLQSVVDYNVDGAYPSDHLPVVVKIAN